MRNQITEEISIDGDTLTLEGFLRIARNEAKVLLTKEALGKINRVRKFIERISQSSQAYYGINTGFGAMAETKISVDDIQVLQRNLILSHAIGMGEPLSFEEARGLMLLRANTLAKGNSGTRAILVENLIALLNSGCAPFVPRKGSVGASGDLGPLAHVAMLLIGEGDAFIGSERVSANVALKKANIAPVVLEAKEGLALINGTQCMASVGSISLLEAEKLCDLADIIGACSLDALKGSTTPFDERIHQSRSHLGQLQSAKLLREMLAGSEIRESHRDCLRVQDAYSLRCMPQVHGASRQAIAHVREILETEINSSTDNPLVFEIENSEECDVLSGGNFHGQPLGLGLDYLAMACSELANISERRIEQMINPALSKDLPAFLTPNPGLNSGYMVLQVAAAALVNENKVLCHPASCDSIPTSANREDHVSMGMTSANKVKIVIENVFSVLAIELMAACQALDMRAPLQPSAPIQRAYAMVRQRVSFAECDRVYENDMLKTIELVKDDSFRDSVLSMCNLATSTGK